MHRALAISEIIAIVSQQILSGRRDDRALLSFALALIGTLPADARHKSKDSALLFTRPLIGSDWERLNFYAKRVRRLYLTDLDVHVHHEITFPALTDLVIERSARTSLTVCDFICSTLHLHSLDMARTSLTAKSLIHLSHLPYLQKLSAKVTLDSQVPTPLGAVPREYCFPALFDLRLEADSWTHAIDFFAAHMCHSPLQIIQMQIAEIPSPQQLNRLLDTFLDHCSPSTLRQLLLHPDDSDEQPENLTCVLEPHSIRRLFAFLNLEVLCIALAVSYEQIDDLLIDDIASAWPQLRQLDLRFRWGTVEEPTMTTIYGLSPLAECSRLTSLSINVNATIPNPTFRPRRDGSFYNSGLVYLAVGNSPIGDPVAVASFLSNFFPNLTDIDAWHNSLGYAELHEEDSAPMLWQEVWSFYQPFVGIRKQERDFAVRKLSGSQ